MTLNTTAPLDTAAPAPADDVLPFPAPRVPSGGTDFKQTGSAADSYSKNAIFHDYDLELTAGEHGTAWAIYTFFTAAREPHQLDVTLAPMTGGAVWLGVANYARQAWDFFGPFDRSFTQQLDPAVHRSSFGTEAVALLVVDGHSTTVQLLNMPFPNQPPVLTIEASVTEGDAPLSVDLTQHASDPDGTVVRYQWDLDDDGTFDANSDTAQLNHAFTEPGVHHVTALAADESGATITASIDITVHGWDVVPLCPGGDQCSLKLVDGTPALAFSVPTGNEQTAIAYARATTPTGEHAADWQFVTLDTCSGLADYPWDPDLAVVDGKPAVAYARSSVVGYAYAQTANGAAPTDWHALELPGTSGGRAHPSLAEVAGAPAIAFFTGFSLRYLRATTSQGTAPADWQNIVVDDSSSSVGDMPALAVVDGAPAVAYRDGKNRKLKYARATTTSGADAGDWQAQSLFGATFTAPSLALIAGRPAIAFGEWGTQGLRYAWATSADGMLAADWQMSDVFHSVGQGGTCLAEINGVPAMAFDLQPAGFGAWSAAYALQTGGGATDPSWSTVQDSCGSQALPTHPALLEVGGKPLLAFHNDQGLCLALRH